MRIGRAYLGKLIVYCYLASCQYLALVLVFFDFAIFCNRHFWRCVL